MSERISLEEATSAAHVSARLVKVAAFDKTQRLLVRAPWTYSGAHDTQII
jgi:hypothetical protein